MTTSRARLHVPVVTAVLLLIVPTRGADPPSPETSRGDARVAEYFRLETDRLDDATFAGITTLDAWTSRRDEYRRQLREMLGLDPWPEKTPLHAQTTGVLDHDEFTVEKLHFQSRPGLYVTGNLYVPKGLAGKAPAVLYVCGHSRQKADNVSFGNKAGYQHHGAWFARHGFVCLTIDTLQLGEIEGLHHGTYRERMWWWTCRGYTPAGVEAWNCVRALDYLETRPEVDAERIGVTGRSGGGAYSWWVAAIDDRIKCAVPVAGITSLKNHVVDGCVEGHCDCMYQLNTYQWDYPLVAALVAPRPLLISNTDKDRIFPLDGVYDVYTKVRPIYALYGATDKLGLQITEGPHKDTQELQVHAFVWMNRYLKGEEPPISRPAEKLFEPQQLRVFETLPTQEVNTSIQETFVPLAEAVTAPPSTERWSAQRDEWRAALREKCFRAWPDEKSAPGLALRVEQVFSRASEGVRLAAYDFTSQTPYRLRFYIATREGGDRDALDLIVLNVQDQGGWEDFVRTMRAGFADPFADETPAGTDAEGWQALASTLTGHNWGMAWVAPRGVGPTEWTRDERERTHIRRRFMLLGQTDDGMRVYDVRRAVQALRSLGSLRDVPLWLQGERDAAGWALYASLFEPEIARLDLWSLPRTHREGPIFLNVLRFLDTPQALALAAERSRVRLYEADASAWQYPLAVAKQLGWDEKQIKIRPVPARTE
jgi:dienelactone hydrolase